MRHHAGRPTTGHFTRTMGINSCSQRETDDYRSVRISTWKETDFQTHIYTTLDGQSEQIVSQYQSIIWFYMFAIKTILSLKVGFFPSRDPDGPVMLVKDVVENLSPTSSSKSVMKRLVVLMKRMLVNMYEIELRGMLIFSPTYRKFFTNILFITKILKHDFSKILILY